MRDAKEATSSGWANRLRIQNQVLKDTVALLRKETRLLHNEVRESRGLVREIPGYVFVIQEAKVALANERAREDLGYAEEEILGRDLGELLQPESVGMLKGFFQKRVSEKSIPAEFEAQLIKKSGEPLNCEVRVKRIRYQGRKAFLLLMMGLDARNQKEKDIRQSEKEEALMRVISGLEQEFNGWLCHLDGDLNAEAGETPVGSGLGERLKKMEAAKEHAHAVLERLRTLTRTDPYPDEGSPFDLKKVVQDAVALTRGQWREPFTNRQGEIQLRTYLRALSPVEGHPTEMRDAFVGLILNAIEALPQGGEIYLTAEEHSGLARVYIQDNGMGIPEEIQDKIFDPFFTTKEDSRAGLGLTLAKAIVKRHGGDIEVMSQRGHGAVFTIKLPLARKGPSSKQKTNRSRLRDARVLMVAKEGIVIDLLAQLLINRGARITMSSDEDGMLKLVAKRKFDLIIVDIEATNRGFTKTLLRLREMRPKLPIVMVSLEAEGTGFRVEKNQEADMIVGRPLDMDKILSHVSRTMAAG
jgi:PAS domain S-box-containing protein